MVVAWRPSKNELLGCQALCPLTAGGFPDPLPRLPWPVPWRPLPGAVDHGDPLPVRASLDRLSRALGAPGADSLAQVFDRWEALVGPDVAAHARPTLLAGGRLVVAVDHPAWATQLRWLGPALLARLATELGAQAPTRLEVKTRM